jgi:hypothetical protein
VRERAERERAERESGEGGESELRRTNFCVCGGELKGRDVREKRECAKYAFPHRGIERLQNACLP